MASGFHNHDVGLYIYHWAFMAAFALCSMHVQVATRYLRVLCNPCSVIWSRKVLRVFSMSTGFCLERRLCSGLQHIWSSGATRR